MEYEYNTTAPVLYSMLHAFAIENKKNQTEAECALWERIRSKRLGKKFNRQHIIDQYIVDFVCLKSKLIIEGDGGYHCQEQQQEADEQRTRRLESLGFFVIRFDNDEILDRMDYVIKTICRYI